MLNCQAFIGISYHTILNSIINVKTSSITRSVYSNIRRAFAYIHPELKCMSIRDKDRLYKGFKITSKILQEIKQHLEKDLI